jgi:hypothetical protein
VGIWQGAILTWNETHVERNQPLASVDRGVWPVSPGQPFTQGTDGVSEQELGSQDNCSPSPPLVTRKQNAFGFPFYCPPSPTQDLFGIWLREVSLWAGCEPSRAP